MTHRLPADDSVNPDLRLLFGERLRDARVKQGMTQIELAELADLTSQYVSKIESGQINLTLSTVQRLAEALCIDPASLLRKRATRSRRE